jgi:hypothetical protein
MIASGLFVTNQASDAFADHIAAKLTREIVPPPVLLHQACPAEVLAPGDAPGPAGLSDSERQIPYSAPVLLQTNPGSQRLPAVHRHEAVPTAQLPASPAVHPPAPATNASGIRAAITPDQVEKRIGFRGPPVDRDALEAKAGADRLRHGIRRAMPNTASEPPTPFGDERQPALLTSAS